MQVIYKNDSDRSFTLKVQNPDKSTSAPVAYQIPEQITNWQLSEISGIISDVLLNCSEAANALMSAGQALITTADNTDDLRTRSVSFIKEILSNPMKYGLLTAGIELLKYAKEHRTFATLTAILFLQTDERSLSRPDFQARIDLMEAVPPSQLKGLLDFFQKKTPSAKNLNSHSRTSETKTRKNTPQTSL